MSADSPRTTIFQMRAIARHSPKVKDPDAMLTPEKVDHYPHRDKDRLEAVLDDVASFEDAARRLDCTPQDVRLWASVYRLDFPATGGEQ